MNEKILNQVMEDLTIIYETKPYIRIENYFVYTSEIFGDCISVTFGSFSNVTSDILNGILSKYDKVYWCIVPTEDKSIKISIFQECLLHGNV